MQIDPNVKGVINGIVALAGVISLIGVSAFPDYIPQGIAKDVVQTAGFIFTIYGGLNSAGSFLSSSRPGALVTPPPAVAAAQAVADLKPDDPPSKILAVKQAAVEAVKARDPKLGPA